MNQPITPSPVSRAAASETSTRPASSQVAAGIRYFGSVLADPTASREELRTAYLALLDLRARRDAERRRAALADLGSLASDHKARRAALLSELHALAVGHS